MRVSLILMLVLNIFYSAQVFAKEGYLCGTYFEIVERQYKNIRGTNLSRFARDKLLEDLEFGLKHCMLECEGEKFRFCNDVALSLE